MHGMTQKHPIDKASDCLGGATKLAALLGVSAQAISNWKERGVPIERCVAIEQATASEVTRKDLRPDDWESIWPELAKPEPTAAPKWDGAERRKQPRHA